jgi:uncharacterized membrane protein YhaH (DUF805 family)
MGVRQRLKESFLAFDTRLPWWLSYRGSLGRRKFLLGLLPLFVLGVILSGAELPLVLTIFLALPLIGVALGLFLQRLRDVGFPPALALLGFIPVFGWVALAVLSALPGKGRTGTPLWHSFVAGFSALIVISVLGTTPLPTTELVEGVNQGVASELEEEAELPGLTGVERGEPSGAVTEDTSALASAPEEDAEGEETEEEASQEEETQGEETQQQAPPAEPAPAPPASGFEELVAQLRVEPEFQGGYDRSLFRHWIDANGNGCNTRREVLIQESLVPVTVGPRCSLSGGQWYSAFDGVTTTDPSTFDIDHFVPLIEAWDSGVHSWDSGTRQRFANDLDFAGSLIAVSASSNRSKGAKDPAEWLPPNAGYRCEYVRTWVEVKIRWNLSADPAEVSALRSVGARC